MHILKLYNDTTLESFFQSYFFILAKLTSNSLTVCWHQLTVVRWCLSKNREIMCELCSSLGAKGMVCRESNIINSWKRFLV